MEEIKFLWQQLLSQKPTSDDLRYIIEYVEPLRAEAGQQLLSQKPTNDDLSYIIRWVEPLRAEATQLIILTKEEIMEKIKKMY